MSTFVLYFALLSFASALIFTILYAVKYIKHQQWIKSVFFSSDTNILKEEDSRISFDTKLIQAGLTKRDFQLIIVLSAFAGLSVSTLPFILHLNGIATFAIITIALAIAAAVPFIYLEEQKKRV